MFYYLTKYYCDGDAENDTNNMKQKKNGKTQYIQLRHHQN